MTMCSVVQELQAFSYKMPSCSLLAPRLCTAISDNLDLKHQRLSQTLFNLFLCRSLLKGLSPSDKDVRLPTLAVLGCGLADWIHQGWQRSGNAYAWKKLIFLSFKEIEPLQECTITAVINVLYSCLPVPALCSRDGSARCAGPQALQWIKRVRLRECKMTRRFHVNNGRMKEKSVQTLRIFSKYFNWHVANIICRLLSVVQEIPELLVTGAQSLPPFNY